MLLYLILQFIVQVGITGYPCVVHGAPYRLVKIDVHTASLLPPCD